MLAPEMVEALQQHLLLHIGHHLGGIGFDALRIGLVRRLGDAFADFVVGDALFLGPFFDRKIEVEEIQDVGLQARDVPLLRIGVLRDARGTPCRR